MTQAREFRAAARFAADIGLPFNRMVTIHWEKLGIADGEAVGATGHFLKLARERLGSGRFAFAWVRENGPGKGSHVHILCHVPAGCSLGGMQRRWLRRIAGSYERGAIQTCRIGGTAAAHATAPDHYRANLKAVVAYVLKDAADEGGRVIGKRVGWSQNIGRAARGDGKTAGFDLDRVGNGTIPGENSRAGKFCRAQNSRAAPRFTRPARNSPASARTCEPAPSWRAKRPLPAAPSPPAARKSGGKTRVPNPLSSARSGPPVSVPFLQFGVEAVSPRVSSMMGAGTTARWSMEDGDDEDIVKDGEAVSVRYRLRDGGGPGPVLAAGDRLRDLDTGRVHILDGFKAAAIRVEAAKERLPIEAYLRDRLHYAIERDGQ